MVEDIFKRTFGNPVAAAVPAAAAGKPLEVWFADETRDGQ